MIRAVADLDLRGAIARLSPAEFGALQEYASLFVDDAATEMAATQVDVAIDELSLRSDASGDRATVFVESFATTIVTDDDTISVSTDGRCLTVTSGDPDFDVEDNPFAKGPVCGDDLTELSQGSFGMLGLGGDDDLPQLPTIDTPSIGITTTKIGGQWYVAPIATGFDAAVAGLEALDRPALDAIVDYVEALLTSFQAGFEDSFTTTFESTGQPLTDDFYPADEQPAAAAIDFQALEALVRTATSDEAVIACVLDGLAAGDPTVSYELADAYSYDYPPSSESQDIFFAILGSCQASG